MEFRTIVLDSYEPLNKCAENQTCVLYTREQGGGALTSESSL